MRADAIIVQPDYCTRISDTELQLPHGLFTVGWTISGGYSEADDFDLASTHRHAERDFLLALVAFGISIADSERRPVVVTYPRFGDCRDLGPLLAATTVDGMALQSILDVPRPSGPCALDIQRSFQDLVESASKPCDIDTVVELLDTVERLERETEHG